MVDKSTTRRVLSCETCEPSIIHFVPDSNNDTPVREAAYCYCGVNSDHHRMTLDNTDSFYCPSCGRGFEAETDTCRCAESGNVSSMSVMRVTASVPRDEDT